MTKEDVLSDFNRGRILGSIQTQPGITFNELRHKLNMPNGTAVYHLEVLERERLIKSERDGMNRRFFPWGMQLDRDRFFPSEQQWRVINVILERASQGVKVTQADIVKLTGSSKQALNYHVKRLVKAGVVQKEKGGFLWVRRERIS